MGMFRDYLNEKLKTIYFNKKELKWNPNKTESEFKDRIKQRTNLSEEEFYKIIQKGIDKTKLPEDSAICLYFMISKFVLVLNTKEMIITTIRDGKWDKPGNNCKHTKIVNEDIIQDQELVNLFNENTSEAWSFYIDENFDINIETNCNVCFKVEL